MRALDHIRQPGYLAAMKAIALNARKPEPEPWYRRWTLWMVTLVQRSA